MDGVWWASLTNLSYSTVPHYAHHGVHHRRTARRRRGRDAL